MQCLMPAVSTLKRKSLKLLLSVMLLAGVHSLHAQRNSHLSDSVSLKYVDKLPRSVIVKTNILPVIASQIPVAGEYRLMAEFVTGRRQSVFAGISWLGKSLMLTMTEKANNQSPVKLKGYRVQGGYKLYLTPWHFRPAGFYIGPHASWSDAEMYNPQNRGNYISIKHFSMSMLAGLQFIVNDRISADFFIGHGYKNNVWREYNNLSLSTPVEDLDMGVTTNIHYKFSFGCNIGIAF